MIPYNETTYGFVYGPISVTRLFSDPKKGWVVIGIATPKHRDIQVYVTKTGKLRILDDSGEWKKEAAK